MNKHQVKGTANEVTGSIKKEVGKMTGDRTLQAKGTARELKGKAQQGVGNAKEDMKADRDIETTTVTTRRTPR